MPVFLAQMNKLEDEEKETWEALKAGDFVVAKSEIPGSMLFVDQALEQEIKDLKAHGGMVGLSQHESPWVLTTAPQLAKMVKTYLNSFSHSTSSTSRSEHYQLSGNVSTRIRENATKLHGKIELHCEGNPFIVECPLKSLVSSALVPEEAADVNINFGQKGQQRLEDQVKKLN